MLSQEQIFLFDYRGLLFETDGEGTPQRFSDRSEGAGSELK